MKTFAKNILAIALLFISYATTAANDTTAVRTRPKVGLVLSGGGAKGAAHIGVIKYLEEAGIPIDYIAGTSMGSIVGGMYAMGYSSSEILALISSVDWNRLISNEVDRRKISFDQKSQKHTQLLNIPFSLKSKNKDKLQSRSFRNSLPSGIVSGDNLINLFNSLSVGYSDSLAFSELPTPFICIATNMINGEAEVLDKGVFTKSLRASMAIPVLFDPIKIGNSLYADGGLVCNFPVEQCRAMGADYIIGVSMSPGLKDNPENLSSIFSQVKQLKEIITDKDFDRYHEQCDIFISPDLKGVGMLSFDAESVARVTQSGYEAASAQADKFVALKEMLESELVDEATHTSNKRKAINILQNRVKISNIELLGVDKDVERWMRRSATKLIGRDICKDDIDELVSVYYGTGNHDSITYTLHDDATTPGGYIIRFKFVDKPAHALGLGVRFDTQDWLSVLLHLGINDNHMSGFKSYLDAKIGTNQWLNLNLSYGHMLYPRINLGYTFRNSELDVYDMDVLEMNTKFLQHKFKLYLSENYSRTFSIGGGFEAELQTPRKVIYSLYDVTKRDLKAVNTLGAFAYFKFDNLNKNRLPTRGVKGNINFNWKDAIFDKEGIRALQLGSVVFGFESYIPIIKERLVIVPQLYGSFLFGKGATNGLTEGLNPMFNGPVPSYPHLNNIVGGAEMGRHIDHQLPFIGLNKISFAFNNLAIARADVRVRVHKSHYLTAMFNYGRSGVDIKNFFKESSALLWEDLYTYNASNWWGAGVRYSIDTKAGPVNFDVSSSNISKSVNLYFSFGYYF